MATNSAARPVQRSEFSSRDEGEVEEFIRQMYIGNHTRFVAVNEQARFTATVAEAGRIAADQIRTTVDYCALTDPFGYFFFLALHHGRMQVKSGRDELRITAGNSFFYPLNVPLEVGVFDVAARVLRLPAARLAAAAEESAGIDPAGLRFESVTPVTPAMGRHWSALMDLASDALLADDSVMAHPVLAEELTRTAAVTALHTFPNTAMTAPYQPGPGWVPPATVRRATDFMQAHADRPLTLEQVAAAAGVTGRALQYAFRRYYGTTPIGYLRRIRLERADAELRAADPDSAVRVSTVARKWGWASPSQFSLAYQERFGVRPSHTLKNR
jgi:AraC-like DNA-binding protein